MQSFTFILSLPCYLTTIETARNPGVAVMLLVLYEIL